MNEKIDALGSALQKRIAELSGKKLRLERAWGNLCATMASPASDGQFLYVSMGQGQVACLGLDGRIVWAIAPFKKLRDEFRDIPHGSPVLIGDILYTTSGTEGVGLDKKTGKVLWTATIQDSTVGIAKVVRLDLAGKPLDVIVTPCCRILRPADGKLLGTLPFEDRDQQEHLGRGTSVVSSGPVVYMNSSADNYRGPLKAFRLKAASADAVAAERIWATRRWQCACPFTGKVATPDRYYCGAIYDPPSGKLLARFDEDVGGISELLIGQRYYWAKGNGNCYDEEYQAWNHRRPDGKALVDFGVASQDGKRLAARNRLGDASQPRVPYLEKWAVELYNNPDFTNGGGGRPAHFLNQDAGMMPQGNRLFIRSIGHLYCIGDPSQPYSSPKH
jgi:hypothetical protein